MKGYKGFNSDLTCRGFQYEIGKEYEFDGEIEVCNNGFHFCKNIIDVKEYYNITEDDIKLCEIEATGEIKEEEDKCVTNKIKIIREISKEEMYILGNEGKENRGLGNIGNYNTGDRNTRDWNIGDMNTGCCNTGNRNTGNWNTGNRNTGYSNAGNWNTGDSNTGGRNTGYKNTGDRNTGDFNTGYYNTGNWNTGNRNTGDWNITNYSTGCFCTKETKIKFFDKNSDITLEEWKNSEAFYILNRINKNKWINYEDMTLEEKEKYPNAEICDGYLKELDLKEEATKWWNNLTEKEKEIIRAIPNYNRTKFRKIMGGAKIG